MEPIWVLVRAPTTLVDSAATSALFSPEIVVVESEAACVVVTALICPAPSEPMTEGDLCAGQSADLRVAQRRGR